MDTGHCPTKSNRYSMQDSVPQNDGQTLSHDGILYGRQYPTKTKLILNVGQYPMRSNDDTLDLCRTVSHKS